MENKHLVIGGVTVLIIVLIVLFLLPKATKNTEPGQGGPLDFNINQGSSQAQPSPVPQNVTQLAGQDLKVGTPAAAVAAGDTITVHYIGSFLDGREFDNSYKRKQTFSFIVGARQVIPGFEQGVVGMKVGGKRKILIPADLAYGAQGSQGIPPNTPIQFEVELLEIKPKPTPTPAQDPNLTPSPTPGQ